MSIAESEMRMARNDETICGNRHRDGFTCTRRDAHRGDHAAHDRELNIVMRWRGGRNRWAVAAAEKRKTHSRV